MNNQMLILPMTFLLSDFWLKGNAKEYVAIAYFLLHEIVELLQIKSYLGIALFR